ncbi:MAG: Ig-like domain-containing protein, partial [Pyrinomonadaceae bacterium]
MKCPHAARRRPCLRSTLPLNLALASVCLLLAGAATRVVAGVNDLVSVNIPGTQTGNGAVFSFRVSNNGRYVVFTTTSSNLVANDTNGVVRDIFVRDLQTNTTALVSVNSAGTATGNGEAGGGGIGISADGRYVLFTSTAGNLVTNDTNAGTQDIFVRDLQTGTTRLVTVNAPGTGSGNATSTNPFITPDGRYVVFTSTASDLVAGDANARSDVFVRDLQLNTTTLVSKNSAGTAGGNGNSASNIAISDDGRFVAFASLAGDLVANDSNGATQDVFLRDLQTNTTTLISVNSAGTGSGNSSSGAILRFTPDGRFVAFGSNASNLTANDTNGTMQDIYLRDTQAPASTSLVSVNASGTGSGNSSSGTSLRMSDDGRYVAFTSGSNNLVANDTNEFGNIFRRDMQAGVTALANVNNAGTVSNGGSNVPGISADGRYVVFANSGSNLVPNDTNGVGFTNVFVRDFQANTTTLVSVNSAGTGSGNGISSSPLITPDGQTVVFFGTASNLVAGGGDNNGTNDVFARDLAAGVTFLASVKDPGTSNGGNVSGNRASSAPDTSASGRYVVFESNAGDLVPNDVNAVLDVFLRDEQTGVMTLVSVNLTGTASGNGFSLEPKISADGRLVAFMSGAADLTSNTEGVRVSSTVEDVYVRNLQTNTTTLVSVNRFGTATGNASSVRPAMSRDGRYVAFLSEATDLVSTPDANSGAQDIFVRDMQTGTTTLVSVNSAGTATGNNLCFDPYISADGRYVAFRSLATDLVTHDTNNATDIFVRDLQTNTTRLVTINSAGTASGDGGSFDDPTISPNGRYVAFVNSSTNLVAGVTSNGADAFVRDMQTGVTTLVTVNPAGTAGGNGSASGRVLVSDDGRYVVFHSFANNLVATDTNFKGDVFLRDRQTNTTSLLSVNTTGGDSPNGESYNPSMSADARYIYFGSTGTNLTATPDTNGVGDLFLRDRVGGTTTLVSRNSAGTSSAVGETLTEFAFPPVVTSGGHFAVYESNASTLVTNDANGFTDVFRYNAQLPDTPPTVSLTSPTDGASFSSPTSINLAASATDDSGVVGVDFYANSTLIGTDITSPYGLTWNASTPGTYALTAVAFDNGGLSTTSSAVTVTISGASGGLQYFPLAHPVRLLDTRAGQTACST